MKPGLASPITPIELSLPSRERGLKPPEGLYRLGQGEVAPFTGAWIETPISSGAITDRSPSLPSRERGLKLAGSQPGDVVLESLPSRERGLKPRDGNHAAGLQRRRSLHGSVD